MSIERTISEAAFTPFAVEAAYTDPGETDPITVDVVLDFGVNRIQTNARSRVITQEDQADFLRSEVRPKPGSVLEITDEHSEHHERKWKLGSVLEDDGHIVTVVLKEELE